MARMPRARTIPKTVAQLMISYERGLVVLRLDGQLRGGGGQLGTADLRRGEWLGPLDQPIGRGRLEMELAHGVFGDHGIRCRRARGKGAHLLNDRVGEAVCRC